MKKAQPNFLQTTRKPEIILTLFITVLTISFLLLSTSSASVEFYKLTTLDKMILLAVKVPSSNKRLIFPSILFTDNQWQEAVFEKCKKGGGKLTAEKGNLLAGHHGNAVSNFFKSIFIVKQVVLLFFGYIYIPNKYRYNVLLIWFKIYLGNVYHLQVNCCFGSLKNRIH